MNKTISYGRQNIDENDIKSVVKILKSNSITQGKIVSEFGFKIAKFVGAKYGVAVSNGTAALHLSLLALKLKPGDEVITTPITFCATANAVLYNGADIKLADIDPKTLNIDLKEIEKKITKKTKAIIAVDFRGHAANLYEIYYLAKKHKIKVIEDASHSLGSKYKKNGRTFKCGDCNHADLATFSFHPVKHITTGEGGVVTTNNLKLYKKILLLKKHGIDKNQKMLSTKKQIGSWKYDMLYLGYNYRLTNFQAALGISQLQKIKYFMSERRKIVNFYNQELKKIKNIILPYEEKGFISNFHLYIIQVKRDKNFNRYSLFNYFKKNKIITQVHYIPLHNLKFYKKKYSFKESDFPFSQQYYNQALSLPLYPGLSQVKINKVVKVLKEYFK
ncbi:UDP-4-amino-4,6-dideoxy-N-acetyl-beta-L-altrosamine transaminase [Candidatus Pelagibacter sp.]|nr:UDP-4-amino-4,6-dideoxy-N-acetyl-beta-L-altrosamine transaminase [Candidatus Pelagibacter sp.]